MKKYRKWQGRSEREPKWNFLKRKLVLLKLKHTQRESMHIHAHTHVHTQDELNNQAEERSSILGERYEDIMPKWSGDTRGIIFQIWEIKRLGRVSEEGSHTSILSSRTEMRQKGEAGFEETLAKNFHKLKEIKQTNMNSQIQKMQ